MVATIRSGRTVCQPLIPPVIGRLTTHLDFQVTENLPNVTWSLPRNWAGNIPVQREGHPNDTLFFWAFESEEGSFTSDSTHAPWGIWLNGG